MGKEWRGEHDDLTLVSICQHFSTEDAARAYMESIRWPHGPTCPHCGNADATRISKIPANPAAKVRPGLHRCAECVQQFTVTVGTVCEDSHIPLNKWLIAFYMMCASKTQVSALQLQRQLELGSYRTALFLCHRIRYALKERGGHACAADGEAVEADETYIGGKTGVRGAASRVTRSPWYRLSNAAGVCGPDCCGKGHQQDHRHPSEEACRGRRARLGTDNRQLYNKAGKRFASLMRA